MFNIVWFDICNQRVENKSLRGHVRKQHQGKYFHMRFSSWLKSKVKMKKKGIIIVVAILTLAISISSVSNKDKEFKIIKNLDIFYSLFKELNYFYVDETDPEKLIEDGINGMLRSLDPYTSFIPESELDEFAFMTTGKYGGIGALIRSAGDFTIISEPYEGFPAQSSGLMAGDTILEIDNSTIEKLKIKDVSNRLKGDPDTKVKIKVKRPGIDKPISISVMRKQIKIDNVPYFGMIDDKTGYINLSNFTRNAASEVENALTSLKEEGAKGIILDLRNNPGGLLIEAVNISNIFIDKNTEVVSTKGKVKNWQKSYQTEYKGVDTKIPLAVLVNRGSASASEIVSGSLQDLDRAVIVGQRTFGKGLVQTTRPLSYNTKLKVTTAKYYIPSGRCIQAIDYSHRNADGSVGTIPDSLINEFKTKNGRVVYDGGGIMPDIDIKSKTYKKLSSDLHRNGLLYEFATYFRIKNESILPANEFDITDEIYEAFKEFVSTKEFEYETESDLALKDLIEKAKKEKYYEISKEAFENLASSIDHDTKKDLDLVRDEISDILRQEIVVRYYYQKGQIRSSLINDEYIEKALEVLKDEKAYNALLQIQDEEVVAMN